MRLLECLDVLIRGGRCWCVCVNYCDFVWRCIELSRELTVLYPMSAFLALSLSNIPTPLTCVLPSPDQMKSLFEVSPFPVQRYPLYHIWISSSRSWAAVVVHSVWTLHVPTVSVFFAIFSFSVSLILVDFPVANFSILPWSSSRGRGSGFTGRHPSRHVFLLFVFMVGFYRLFLFSNSGICTPFCSTLHLRSGLATGTSPQDEKLWSGFHACWIFLHSPYYG